MSEVNLKADKIERICSIGKVAKVDFSLLRILYGDRNIVTPSQGTEDSRS